MITEEVDRYQQCWMTHLLMLLIQFAPRRGIYFSLKITVTFIYGIFKKVDMVASLSIFLFFWIFFSLSSWFNEWVKTLSEYTYFFLSKELRDYLLRDTFPVPSQLTSSPSGRACRPSAALCFRGWRCGCRRAGYPMQAPPPVWGGVLAMATISKGKRMKASIMGFSSLSNEANMFDSKEIIFEAKWTCWIVRQLFQSKVNTLDKNKIVFKAKRTHSIVRTVFSWRNEHLWQ